MTSYILTFGTGLILNFKVIISHTNETSKEMFVVKYDLRRRLNKTMMAHIVNI